MVKILGITKDKIVYTKANREGKDEIRFHHIVKSSDGSYIADVRQFYEFENGFMYGSGQCYGRYIYCLHDGKLLRIDTVTETINIIETDAKRFIFEEDFITLMKKEERWKNYIITPPDTREVFFCNLFPDGADESIMHD